MNCMLLCGLFLVRLLNVVTVRGFFQADEYWQGLEPAHLQAFKFGNLTWEWEYKLRSYAFPFMFEIVYRCVKWTTNCLEKYPWIVESMNNLVTIDDLEYFGVIWGPKLLMVVWATIGEYYTCQLAVRLYRYCQSDKLQKMKLQEVLYTCGLFTLTNWFNGFCITRSFINSWEMSLTAVALYYWPWSYQEIVSLKFDLSLFIAFFLCLQRPSNGLIWTVLGLILIINIITSKNEKSCSKLLFTLLIKLLGYFILAIASNCVIDYYYYGELVFPIFKFIQFNFTTPLSQFYGVAPWHFHIAQSLPILLGASLPLFLWSIVTVNDKKGFGFNNVLIRPITSIKLVILVNVIVFSMLPHKEFRFLYPLQSLLTTMSTLSYLQYRDRIYKIFKILAPLLSVALVIPVIFYQESGSLEIIKFLHFEPKMNSLGFVMPCHSTPAQSYLHRNDITDLWAITCNPPLHLLKDKDAKIKLPWYMDESDHLYDDPHGFFESFFDKLDNGNSEKPDVKSREYHRIWPEYLVIFDHLDTLFMREYLNGTHYKEYKRFFNSWSHWDSRREGDLIIYKKL